MILWVVLSVMLAVAAVIVAAPFIRRHERRQAEALFNAAVYRDQLKEVEAEAALGAIDAAQAEAAKAEIKRRALAAAREEDSGVGLSSNERRFAAIAVSAIVVGGSVGLFALTQNSVSGASALSDGEPEASASATAALFASGAASAPDSGAAMGADKGADLGADKGADLGGKKDLPSVDEMIRRVVKRLDANPQDVAGWKMLGWSYAGVERYVDAAQAYGKAIALAPNAADLRSAKAEALIRAANGSVTPEAKTLIDEALKLDAKDARARFFLSLDKEQQGDKAGALAELKRLEAETEASDPWLDDVKQKIAELENGAPASPATTATSEHDPSAQDVKAAETMPADDRMSMIRRMVDQLAERLEKSPLDADGWIKLMRSRTVLNENDKARQALDRALKAFEKEPAARDRIVAAGKEMGLTP